MSTQNSNETKHPTGALCLALALGIAAIPAALGQGSAEAIEKHRAAAKAAAGQDLLGVYNAACGTGGPQPGRGPGARGAGPRPTPPREEWYAEPVKVFDNLYYLGTKVHGAWAVNTPEGIIIIDALFGYAAEPEIIEGLKKVGLDPARIKYVIVSHGHGDHHGGAKLLQDSFNPKLVLGGPDWDLMERDTRTPAPRRDVVAEDGQRITLGGSTVTLYLTPGHTAGTLSILISLKDGPKTHLAASWGGTVISANSPIPMLEAYVKSAARFRDLASQADVLISNHTAFDGALPKLEAAKNRKPGDPNPYVVGKETVSRYLTVAEECGKATLLEARSRQ